MKRNRVNLPDPHLGYFDYTFGDEDISLSQPATPEPEIPESMTWGQSMDLNILLLSALKQANRDKADIRAIESQR